MLQRLSFLSVAVLVAACGTTRQYQRASAGPTGCPVDQITISDKTGTPGWSTLTWVATCHGQRFQCSSAGEVSCTAQSSASAGGEVPTTSGAGSAGGCQYDTQCKGDRVCSSGACVDP